MLIMEMDDGTEKIKDIFCFEPLAEKILGLNGEELVVLENDGNVR